MKKLLALLLALLMIFSLSSCKNEPDASSNSLPTSSDSKTETEDTSLKEYVAQFDQINKGYITHSGGGDYTIVEDSAYECTDDFYLFLPEGSVFYCDKEFYFLGYTNTEGFALNPWIMRNSGFTVNQYTPDWATGKFTLSKDCFVRFSVKGSLSDIKISVPEDLITSVLAGSKNDMLIAPSLAKMNEYFATIGDSVNYIFISDLHNGSFVNDPDNDGLRNYDSVEAVNTRLERKAAVLATAVSYVNICPYLDFIVVGGDIINGYETEESLTYQAAKKSNPSLTVKEHVIDQLQDILAPLKNCKKPVFILAGNHDFNDGHTLWLNSNHPGEKKRADLVLSDLDWDKNVLGEFINVSVIRDPDYSFGGKSVSKYYYYDLNKNGKTTRIICLDLKDGRRPFDANGNLTEDPSVGAGYCYSDYQMKWLAEVALKGSFDNTMIFAHSGTSEGTSKLEPILTAYQTKNKYVGSGSAKIESDFTGRTSGGIMLYHHGHEHEQFYNFGAKTRYWTFCSDAMSPDIFCATDNSVYKYNQKDNSHVEFTRGGSQK